MIVYGGDTSKGEFYFIKYLTSFVHLCKSVV